MSATNAIEATHPARLRVLLVSPYFPFPPVSGVEMRIYQLARQVASRHDLTLLSYANSTFDTTVAELSGMRAIKVVARPNPSQVAKRVAQFRSVASISPFAVQAMYSAEMQDAISEVCSAVDFDVIHVESSTLCNFTFPLGVPIVLDEHNVEYELLRRLYEGERSVARRWFNRLEYLRFRRFEQACWRRVQGCVVTSDREEPTVRAVAPGTAAAVVPNGVDLDYFARWTGPTQPNTVMFNGVLNYRPNLDAATHLVEEVWPLVRAKCPTAELTIVGNASEREAAGLRRPGVSVAGKVPDIRPYLNGSTVIAVPIRMGGGTRLKVVEALSAGKAMVSTSVGCEGIAVHDGEHLLIANDAETFAEKILQLFDDQPLRERLGERGRELAETSYSWETAGDRLQALYDRVGPDRSPARQPAATPEPEPEPTGV